MIKEILLDPISHDVSEADKIESRLILLLKDEIYLPLIEELGAPKELIINSRDALIEAIRSGKIWFYRGEFKGRFSSAISRELNRIGAKWDRRQGSFKVLFSDLPIEVKDAISVSEFRYGQLVSKVDRKLSELLPDEIADKVSVDDLFDSAIYRMDRSVEKSVKQISILPKFTDAQKKQLSNQYTQNLKLDIKKWADNEILKLREDMQKSTMAGNRYEYMIKRIQKSYYVSKSKAKFLARQETNLLVSKVKEIRYADAGVNLYKWVTVVGSPNHPVRPRHKELGEMSKRGVLFRFDDPPVMDDGKKKNPGEDWGCRCSARPVVRFLE